MFMLAPLASTSAPSSAVSPLLMAIWYETSNELGRAPAERYGLSDTHFEPSRTVRPPVPAAKIPLAVVYGAEVGIQGWVIEPVGSNATTVVPTKKATFVALAPKTVMSDLGLTALY